MKQFPRMYVISSSKLNKGKATAQSCHVIASYALTHPEKFEDWDNNYIVCLRGTPQEIYNKVFELVVAESKKPNPDRFLIPSIAEYHEPDMGNELTAVAVLALNERQVEVCESLFKDLPLV